MLRDNPSLIRRLKLVGRTLDGIRCDVGDRWQMRGAKQTEKLVHDLYEVEARVYAIIRELESE